MKKRTVEILAPGGSYESFIAAIHAGADAVYIGGSLFGARAFADNLQLEQLKEAIDYSHLHGRKLYLTVNTLVKEGELQNQLYDYLTPLYEHGLDAVIVQDVGVFRFIRKHFPGMDIHASTQMTLAGVDGCRLLEKMGASRVVTSRELSLEEIKEIHENTNMEIESFVHGALCYCYSGQCLLSSMIGGRSGNRGRCAQPCRLPYELPGMREERKKGKYLLSPKDICTLEILPDIVEAGVYSLKIEGRMKRPEYTAGVLRIYRKYVDMYLEKGRKGYQVDPEDMGELMDLYNRGGFSTGYYKTRNGREMMSMERPNHWGTKAVKVTGVTRKEISLQALEALHHKDSLDVKDYFTGKRKEILISGEYKRGERFQVQIPEKHGIKPGNILARTRNQKLLDQLAQYYKGSPLQEKINGKLKISRGDNAIISLSFGTEQVQVSGPMVLAAQNQPLSEEKVRAQITRTGDSPFGFRHLEIQLEDGCFLPKQAINQLRRNGMDALKQKVLQKYRRTAPMRAEDSSSQEWVEPVKKTELHVSLENLQVYDRVLNAPMVERIYLDSQALSFPLKKEEIQGCVSQAKAKGKELWYIMPWILRADIAKVFAEEEQQKLLFSFDGILIKNYESLSFLKEQGYKGRIMADHNLYTFNGESLEFWREAGVNETTIPLELNREEIRMRGTKDSEILVYGYLPLMVSAQCIQKNTQGCTATEGSLKIKDRKSMEFRVKNLCRFCCNIIYNSVPVVLADQMEEMKEMGISMFRLSFTHEGAEQTAEILKAYTDILQKGKPGRIPNISEFTRGHYKRGIE